MHTKTDWFLDLVLRAEEKKNLNNTYNVCVCLYVWLHEPICIGGWEEGVLLCKLYQDAVGE